MADWAGQFGNAYTARNNAWPDRREFWRKILSICKPKSVLEPGANRGFNLGTIRAIDPEIQLWATDVNRDALRAIKSAVPRVNAVYGDIRDIPFKDDMFDLVISVGVLIHLKPHDWDGCMKELTRCTKRYILLCEYDCEEVTEIPYRGLAGALYKAPFGQIAEQSCPSIRRKDSGFLTKAQGFDRVTWWLYEKGGYSPGKAQ